MNVAGTYPGLHPAINGAGLDEYTSLTYSLAVHTVVETPEYLRQRIPEAERNAIADYLARNPTAGELIPGTGGARKVRFAMKGRGKSGGYRVITYFGGVEIPLFILTAYKKGERANLSAAQRNALRKVLSALTREYRQGVKQSAKKSRR